MSDKTISGGIWSATPTPLTTDLRLDTPSVPRLVEHHVKMGVTGLMLMLRVYGGPKIECWMTGLKELLVQMGIFSTHTNLLEYPLTEECRRQITEAVSGADGLGFKADRFEPAPV